MESNYLDMARRKSAYHGAWPVAMRAALEIDIDSIVYLVNKGNWALAQFCLHKAIGQALSALPPEIDMTKLRDINGEAKIAWGMDRDHSNAHQFVCRVDECLGILTRIKVESHAFMGKYSA